MVNHMALPQSPWLMITGLVQCTLTEIHFSFQVHQLQKGGESQVLQRSEQKLIAMMVSTVSVFVVTNTYRSIYFILWNNKAER